MSKSRFRSDRGSEAVDIQLHAGRHVGSVCRQAVCAPDVFYKVVEWEGMFFILSAGYMHRVQPT